MSDLLVRTLARRAGEGDLLAARKLVSELEREQGVPADKSPAFLPPLSTGSRDADEALASIDALVARATEKLNEPWLASTTRLWPRPGLPGGRLVGAALDAALASSSTPAVGWAWEPHYHQVLALAVRVDALVTLGVSTANGEWSLRPSGHWPDEIHQWTVRPRPPSVARNCDVLSAPLALRLAAWAQVDGPASRLSRVRFSQVAANTIRDALAATWTPSEIEFPNHDHRCFMAIAAHSVPTASPSASPSSEGPARP